MQHGQKQLQEHTGSIIMKISTSQNPYASYEGSFSLCLTLVKVSFNADQEFIKNWAGAVRGAVALRKGICLPSFPVPKVKPAELSHIASMTLVSNPSTT